VIWILIAAVIAAVTFFAVRSKPAVDALSNIQRRKQEAALLPELQKASQLRMSENSP
jgi:beta-lactam-binding protein with PASTA domain